VELIRSGPPPAALRAPEGSSQDLFLIIRRHYQVRTATFEMTSPGFVPRISRPAAAGNTAGSWKADGILAREVLDFGCPLSVRRGGSSVTRVVVARRGMGFKN
jgi:hypothetical protein